MLKIAIAGVTGYSGEELLKILTSHPEVEITYVSAKEERSQKIQEIYPYLNGVLDLECKTLDIDEAGDAADLVFLAVPHTVSMGLVPSLLKKGKRVVDISADYRLKNAAWYPQYYGFEHTDHAQLQGAVYGLPEAERDAIKSAQLVANPGCYPTGTLLGLLPLLRRRLAWSGELIVDAKSGFSGAGRKAAKGLMGPEDQENFKAYKVLGHQHEAEIRQCLENHQVDDHFVFVPHLLPVERGILTTIYLKPKSSKQPGELREYFESFYAKEPFVRVLPEGEFPELKNVRETNQCHIGLGIRPTTGTWIIITAIV